MIHTIDFDSVADLYDHYVTVDFDIPFFLAEARHAGGKALELMSGTGRISLPLLKAGIDLTCVDYAEGMLRVLRRKLERDGLDCPVIHMDVTELELRDRYGFMFIPFNSFSEIVDPALRQRALVRMRTHLAENGRCIVTLHNPAVRVATLDGTERMLGSFDMENGRRLIVRTIMSHDPASRLASGRQYYEISDASGKIVEQRVLPVRFSLIPREEFEEMACEAGFAVDALFGDYDESVFERGSSRFMIWRLVSR